MNDNLSDNYRHGYCDPTPPSPYDPGWDRARRCLHYPLPERLPEPAPELSEALGSRCRPVHVSVTTVVAASMGCSATVTSDSERQREAYPESGGGVEHVVYFKTEPQDLCDRLAADPELQESLRRATRGICVGYGRATGAFDALWPAIRKPNRLSPWPAKCLDYRLPPQVAYV
jgi:hypothetical protein